MWEPAKLEQQVQYLESNVELGFAFCDVKIFHHRQLTQNGIYGLKENVEGHFFRDFIVGDLTIYFSSTMVIRKACYDKLGELNENLKSGDHDFICRLLLNYPGAIINGPLTMIRRHDSNHSKLAGDLPFREYIQTLKLLLNEQHISKSTYRKMVGRNHYQSGLYYTRQNQSALARQAYWRSYRTDPSRLKALVRFLFPAL